MKVMVIASTGGHLAQLAEVRRHWPDVDVEWVTFHKPDAVAVCGVEPVVWAHHPTTRNVGNAIRNAALAVRVLRRSRPDVVLSNGAGVAVPFFVVAKLLGIPTVYMEVFDRVALPTLSGLLCYPIADQFLIQWPSQRRFYPQAELVGQVY